MSIFQRMHNRWGIIAIGAFALMGVSVMPFSARAITLIPPSLEIGLIPGQPTETSIKLFNETPETLELYTEPRNFTAKEENGQPAFDFTAPQEGLSSWIKVEAGPIVLDPGERYEVPVTITPPLDADPGGHYASVFFTTTPPAAEVGQVRIASKVGTLLLTRVEGDVSEAGSISEFTVQNGKRMFAHPPVSFSSRFKNSGNVHLRPTGTITIKNQFGKVVDTVDFNPSKGATLPQSIRKYEATWEMGEVQAASAGGWKNFWTGYGNEKNNFGLGKYSAVLSVSAGTEGAVTDTATVAFWLIPWHVILVWGLAVIIFVIVLITLIKRYNAWIIKKAGK